MACIKFRVFVVLRLPLSISIHETATSSSYAARRGRPIRGGDGHDLGSWLHGCAAAAMLAAAPPRASYGRAMHGQRGARSQLGSSVRVG
eukprot:COSAG01_NODE_6051_length_3879_cov_1.779365_6_plen_89_part_00